MKKLVISSILCIIFVGLATRCLALNKSMTRTEDPIVILGNEIKGLLGADPETLALMTFMDGKFSPVPFQIDQKKEDGLFAFQHGAAASKDPDPALDENDELVFMINDLGGKAPADVKPENVDMGMEIEITDPVNNNKGWVYVFKYKGIPPKSELDYVDLKKEEHYLTFVTRNIQGKKSFVCGHATDKFILDQMQAYLPDGTLCEDILDRLKMRGMLKLKFLPTLKLALDGWVKSDHVGWNDGPVRVIGRYNVYVKLAIFKWGIDVLFRERMYRNGLMTTIDMNTDDPSGLFQSSSLIKNSTLLCYMDFNKNIMGHHVYSEHNPPSKGLLLDNKTTPNELELNCKDNVNWVVGYGPLGAIMAKVFTPEEWGHVQRTFYLNENLEKSVNPEDDKGEIAVGWNIKGTDQVNTNTGKVGVKIYYFEPGFKPPMERDIINIHDQPVTMAVAVQ